MLAITDACWHSKKTSRYFPLHIVETARFIRGAAVAYEIRWSVSSTGRHCGLACGYPSRGLTIYKKPAVLALVRLFLFHEY